MGHGGHRTLVGLAFAVTLTSIMGNSLLAPALPDVLADFGRPDRDAGLLVAATSLPGVVVAPVIGVLADRFGRRRVLTPCLAIFGAAGTVAVTAPTFAVLLAARFAMGFGAAGLVNLAIVLLSDTFEGDERTARVGRNTGVLTVGLATFPLASGVVTDLAGWRWALAPYSLGLVVAAVAWRALPADAGRTTAGVREQLDGIGELIRRPVVLASYLAAGLGFAAMFGVFLAILPGHLEAEFGLGAGWRGVVLGLPAITSSLSAFNLGRIRSRLATGTLLVAAGLAWVVSFTTIGLAGALWPVLLAALLYGAAEGAMFPTMQLVALGEADDDQRASAMAIWTGFARFGQTVGPLLAALALAAAGSTPALLLGALLSGGMVVTFVATGVARRA